MEGIIRLGRRLKIILFITDYHKIKKIYLSKIITKKKIIKIIIKIIKFILFMFKTIYSYHTTN